MSSTPPGNVAAGTVVVDRYRLDAPTTSDLADAAVWEATDTVLDRPVRVTLLSGPHAAGALDAARRAALVSDPRLTRVLDVGTAQLGAVKVAYVITEPFTGSTLTEIVSSGLVDAQQARAVVGEAAAALDVAAQRGVHHLALRPDAVRVDGHRVVVTGLGVDAGLAGVEGPRIDGAASDARDLAALAYYALTARWAGDSLDEPWVSAGTIRPLPAQLDQSGQPVALSTLVPHVDPVLDDVVRRTLHGEPGAPKSPAALAAALRPWGEVSVVAALPSFVQPGGIAGAGGAPVRQSVRGSGSAPTAGGGLVERRPTGRIARAASIPAAGAVVGGAAAGAGAAGMPPVPPPPAGYGAAGAAAYPPAIPPAASQAATQQWAAPTPQGYPQAGHAGAAHAQASGQGGYAQPGAPQGGYPDPAQVPPAPLAPGGFAVEQAPQRRGVNPTPIVLGLVLVGVVLGAAWAVTRALAPVDSPLASDPTPAATAPAESGSPEASAPAPTEPEPAALPVIAGAAQAHEAASCRGEQPEAAPLAVDGDPSTFWFTCTYRDPHFGGLRDGLGFAVTLREPAPVTSITLITNSTGGNVQVRKTTVDKPTEGEVLAEGPIGPTTELTFAQPVVGDSFVLWITELPQTGDANRLELLEITVQ